ncbi:MAG: segregation/condensation protein A [Oscillospiraceae bacterium]
MDNPTFFLEGIVKSRDELQDFSGPLSLILMLLQKNKIEIRDLQISVILEQYLAYISKMQEMDLDLASEFVQMASHLVYIKTRTLLVGEEEVSELDELRMSLEQLQCHDAYMSIKAITPELARAAEQGLLMFSKPAEPLAQIGDKSYRFSHQPAELLIALAEVFSRGSNSFSPERVGVAVPGRIIYGVKEKSEQLLTLLQGDTKKSLKELYQMSASRSEIIATFISVLELCSCGSIEIQSLEGELFVSLGSAIPDTASMEIAE